DGSTGFLIRERDSADLIQKVEKFLQMSYDERKAMGKRARTYMEEHYDRQIVVERYLQAIREITG
ncbi:MAG: glycosyltransferase family 1 protein, partial [Lachnospiraceae bacterium]|nr:glycosyltransferase family 1 protein [Lachnospiraceae bacterium]